MTPEPARPHRRGRRTAAAPQVTPVNASGFSGDFTTAATEVIFGRMTPAEGATKTLSLIEEMKQ